MRSLSVDKNGKLDIVEVSMPKYREHQALVKMESCGVCNGTDMKLIHGKFKSYDSYPAILGHEGVGRVVELGSKVRNFKKGDCVLLPFLEGMTDGYHSAWGALADKPGDGAGEIQRQDMLLRDITEA